MTGTPARPGTATALVTPGTTSTSIPASAQRRQLLEASAEHERVAALEPHHHPSRPGVPHEQRVDRLLRRELAARQLRHVDHLDVGVQAVERRERCEAVDEHDVGLGQPLVAAAREQAGVAGASAHQHHAPPARLAARAARLGATGAQLGLDRREGGVTQPHRAHGVTAREHCDAGRPERPAAGVHAVAAVASSAREHHTRWVVASRTTSALTAGSFVQAKASQASSRSPGRYPRGRHASRPRSARSRSAGTTLRGHQPDVGPGLEQPGNPPQRHRAATHHEHAAVGDQEAHQQRVGRRGARHADIVPATRTPARGCPHCEQSVPLRPDPAYGSPQSSHASLE